MTDQVKAIRPPARNVNDRRAVDTTTPLPDTLGKAPLATLPEPHATKPQRPITIQVSAVLHGFTVQIAFDGTLDQLPGTIERLRALGAEPTAHTPAAPLAAADDLPDGWKLCKKHGAPMRPRNKQNEHWHSHNVGTSDTPLWCKGYPGADSPGYER